MGKSKKTLKDTGVEIKGFQAAILYEVAHGVRKRSDDESGCSDVKSEYLMPCLLLDWMVDNGLKTVGGASRDIIRVEFDYGTKDLHGISKPAVRYFNNVVWDEEENCATSTTPELFEKISRQTLREILYRDGIDIEWIGKRGSYQKIHYVRLYRSAGMAKKGSCLFIREELAQATLDFINCGAKTDDIVALGAYNALVASTIIGNHIEGGRTVEGRIQIRPKQILVMDDEERKFTTKVISVEEQDGQLITKVRRHYELNSTVFDGQGLIDLSIFPKWAESFVLLRNHMFKACCFPTDIQQFMRDTFGDDYETATVTDAFGNKRRVKDIRLITTRQATKFIKLNITFDDWASRLAWNDYYFGVVKTAHESKWGRGFQRMSYQMVNAMDIRDIPDISQTTVDYIDKLKSDDVAYNDFLRRDTNIMSEREILGILGQRLPAFRQSAYYVERRKQIIQNFVVEFKNEGHVFQNADNLTICGSPYDMLLQSVGLIREESATFETEMAVQCYTERFAPDSYLAGFRSPFNAPHNMVYLHNVDCPPLRRYFRLGQYALAVNTFDTDIMDRANGMDFDSDTMYVTDAGPIVERARYCREHYPTIVNNIPKSSRRYENTPCQWAALDNKLQSYQAGIGQSSNLAQLALCYMQSENIPIYEQAVCILSVLAQVYIDSAKRLFAIDMNRELKRWQRELDFKSQGFPQWWTRLKRIKNAPVADFDCAMDALAFVRVGRAARVKCVSTIGLLRDYYNLSRELPSRDRAQLIRILDRAVDVLRESQDDSYDAYKKKVRLQKKYVEYIRKTQLTNEQYMELLEWCFGFYDEERNLAKTAFKQYRSNDGICPLLIRCLWDLDPQKFLRVFGATP